MDKVQDVFSPDIYVRERPREGKTRALEQLKNEVELPKKLGEGEHPHIIRNARTYERGQQYGIFLTPTATRDLSKLLASRTDAQRSPGFLLRAFSCLNLTLEYIHKRQVRHKDVKPKNILSVESGPDEGIIWTDFSNAYGYDDGGEVTYEEAVLSCKYAAPEVVEPGFPFRNAHGKSSDIFSLGCVFIDLLCIFIGGDQLDSVFGEDENRIPFSKNIEQIRTSIDGHLRNPQLSADIRPLLQLSKKMIQRKSSGCPKIQQVVQTLSAEWEKYFCNRCNDLLMKAEVRKETGGGMTSWFLGWFRH